MNDGTSAKPMKFDLNSLDMVMVLRVIGALVLIAAALTAIHILDEGGDYAPWSALSAFVPSAMMATLILICAERLARRDFATLEQPIMLIAGAAIIATIALCIKDATADGGRLIWDPLDDLLFFAPIGFAVIVWFSNRPQPDRALGRPDQYGMYIGAAIVILALVVAIKDMSDAPGDEIWYFLRSLVLPASLGLLLLAFTLGWPMPASVTVSEPQVRDWIFFGGIAVLVLGVLISFNNMDNAIDNELFVLLSSLGPYLGMGTAVIIASQTRHRWIATCAPYLRGLAIAAIVVSVIGGLFLTLDADSEQFWLLWDIVVQPIAFGGLAWAIYEVSQALGLLARSAPPVRPDAAP